MINILIISMSYRCLSLLLHGPRKTPTDCAAHNYSWAKQTPTDPHGKIYKFNRKNITFLKLRYVA